MSAGIRFDEVSFERGGRTVLAQLSFQVQAGERVALMGPSGSGKTTVLRLVLGLELPARGGIWLGDRIVSRDARMLVPPEERGLAVVFQDLALWPHLTVWNNLAFGLQAAGISRDEQHARIRGGIEQLGLRGKEGRHPGELSGGERQRVAIGRAIVMQPDAVLLDEPLANVDVQLKRELLALFREVFADLRSTVLYVSHDLREVAALGGRIIVLEEGRVAQEGSLADLRNQPGSDFIRAVVHDFEQGASANSSHIGA